MLGVALVTTTATQLRMKVLPIGIGEILLILWLLLGLPRLASAVREGVPPVAWWFVGLLSCAR